MKKTKEINLKLTKEQQELLELALCSFLERAERIYNYDLKNNLYYDDLVKQVYAYCSNYDFTKRYRPWEKEIEK